LMLLLRSFVLSLPLFFCWAPVKAQSSTNARSPNLRAQDTGPM
jgi:hypothetical protein